MGRERAGSAAATDPSLRRTAHATRDPTATLMASAKFDRLVFILLVKKTNFFKPLRIVDVPNVTVVQRSVKRALVAVVAVGAKKVAATSCTAPPRIWC